MKSASMNFWEKTAAGAAPDVSGWRVVRSDGVRVYGHVTADNGEISLSLFKSPPATMLFVR